MFKLVIISLFLLSFVSSSSSSFFLKDDLVFCRPDQVQTLMEFKNEFDHSRYCNQNSNFNKVRCDNMTGEVKKLKISGCLSGTLKPNSSLFKLHHLRFLNLSENNFLSSSIPSEFGKLDGLEVLSLPSNGFLGQIPSSFSNLSLLYFLDLSHNELTGGFPLLHNLTKISVLDLEYNHFSGTLISPKNSKNSLFDMHQLRYLNLEFNNFSSSLPYEFGNLNKLEFLLLSSNNFFDKVPPSISNLTLLRQLYLDNNKLVGSFPLVANLTNLFDLQLFNNLFSGTIPSSLFSMPFLSYLVLSGNKFTGPIELPNSSLSSSLEWIFFGDNQFESQILEPISKLTTLKHLDVSYLHTHYPIDLNIFSSLKSLVSLDISGISISPTSLSLNLNIPLKNLTYLTMSRCGIREFPNILKTLRNLELIDISNNMIKGKIPKWVWSLPRLYSMDVVNNSFNGFEGSTKVVLVKSSVRILFLGLNRFEGPLPNPPLFISVFQASRNRFTGEIPFSICNRNSLNVIDLSYNNIIGRFPHCLTNLTFVDLQKNNLEGSIPDTFHVGASIRTLNIGHNRLTGKLPRSLLNCSSLQFLGVENNMIEDTFPFWLKALPKLQVLTLGSNKFYGPISPLRQEPLGFPELRILEISNNKFTGSLTPNYFKNWKASSPTMNEDGGLYMVYVKSNIFNRVSYSLDDVIELQYKGMHMEQAQVLTSYGAIDFSGNLLQGHIPDSIGLLKGLIALNLSNNAFTGHIPPSFSNLTKLESLDLSRNRLSGNIPNGLRDLSFLAYINMSHNHLMGEIPQGTQIIGQPKSSFEGNAGLCGLPLEESCFGTNVPTTQKPKEEADEEEEEEQVLNWKGVVIGYGLGVLLGLIIAQVIASYKPECLAKIIGGPKKLRNR